MIVSREKIPGVVIAGLRGGSGKTIISLGITAAWIAQNITVAPFKKGPDYIDAGWLSRAAGRPCYNLDTYLCTQSVVQASYLTHSQPCDIALIEGNRGLFDGIDIDGTTSTSELAKLLDLPVVLVLDCTKSTRTIAAVLMGCMQFDPDINICGVILNRLAGKRHEGKVRANIERFCNIPVLGALPKLTQEAFPERHMGLVTSEEHGESDMSLTRARQVALDNIDIDKLFGLVTSFKGQGMPVVDNARQEQDAVLEINTTGNLNSITENDTVTIGVVRDSAFQFYYPDNIEALENLGARVKFISPLSQTDIPEVDAIYMGGGFPETHATQLSANQAFRDNLKVLSRKGLPIYAECGGLIFLGESICLDEVVYPMTGILPLRFGLSKRPQGHGYTEVEVVNENPFYAKGEVLRGHEFRYSKVISIDYEDTAMAFKMIRGKGILEKKDGFFKDNTFGTYTHIHALGSTRWAPSLIAKARRFKASRE
ncbi:cobyrinic acid a,c-diamide synthase [Desulfobacter hydrogenophilus]|uniref:Cobyrinate a,c-diamide synthase n=1 Tax=Desulfobacter hydrogenophilus TaxID=2291 RepID=A0A328FE32_9BACT|nr:cobyrinate a,c-diamide synthase [Desulfobacter hydrogenophilus]NDY72572.1 cobyrinate a,c-diamide synthase [Desulfobacter hydrogenophilus]QBH13295.1 cobyrinate a,c-diamide synthase [Desulfobacter hydrogenophilus]RAM01307.1 cobyrinic acid a,c-diamide synthase [Desulfobacter hydrogenophilus]